VSPTIQLTTEEYDALVADASRYVALRSACLRRASHNHNQWLEILLQIPLADPDYQATHADIDFAVDEAFGLAREERFQALNYARPATKSDGAHPDC
jgi:hypothetical protein